MTHSLSSNLGASYLNSTPFADDALVTNSLVLTAVALPVLRRTEDAFAEKTVFFGLKRPVVNRLRLRHFAGAPRTDLFRRGEAYLNCVKVIYVGQFKFYSVLSH